ncbi:hypothetical protein QE47_07585 [Salmonella enterica]|nr:hypothetical protein CHD13_22065 [Salmonella enterica]EBQ9804160.1 hypothetical protein [Salmonella enterica subsp. enterica serovar Rissen]EBS2244404.1 hypothetical protein [Salmonella enterica subsp. enterica serovar Rissen]MIG79182.1 hypothetical protein [Salmonella enterica subsp. enterica]MIM27903.1 hypothetical protein [Salmonella enterica]
MGIQQKTKSAKDIKTATMMGTGILSKLTQLMNAVFLLSSILSKNQKGYLMDSLLVNKKLIMH